MSIFTPPPDAPQRGDRATFSNRVDAFLTWLIGFVGQLINFESNLNTLAAGGAYAIPFLLDASTTDADPGTGKIRFNNAVQSSATVLFVDTSSAGGSDVTNQLAQFGASSSAVRGTLRITKQGDVSKYLVFNVTGVATPTGYRQISVMNVDSSSASPFAANDTLQLQFTRSGDIGTVASAVRYVAGTSFSTTTPYIDFLSIFTSDCDKYVIELSGFQTSTAATMNLQLATNGVLNTTNYTAFLVPNAQSTGTLSSSVTIAANTLNSGYIQGPFTIEISNANDLNQKSVSSRGIYYDNSSPVKINNSNLVGTWDSTGSKRISGFRLFLSSGSFASAKVAVYGIKNSA